MSDLDAVALAASLAETSAHLAEYIERRAREIAEPEIQRAADAVQAARDEQARERVAHDQRFNDVREELWKQLDVQRRRAERRESERDEARARLAEFEAVQGAVTAGKHVDRPLTVSDVLVAHDVTRKALADALDVGHHLNWAQLVTYAESQRAGLHGQRESNGTQLHRVRVYARKPAHVPDYNVAHPASCNALPYGAACWFDDLAETARQFEDWAGWPDEGQYVAHAPAEGEMHIRFEPINEVDGS